MPLATTDPAAAHDNKMPLLDFMVGTAAGPFPVSRLVKLRQRISVNIQVADVDQVVRAHVDVEKAYPGCESQEAAPKITHNSKRIIKKP